MVRQGHPLVSWYDSPIVDASNTFSLDQQGWKLGTTVLKGANYIRLRLLVYEAAQQCFAFDGKIEFQEVPAQTGTIVTADSDLLIQLYFRREEHALKMQNALCTIFADRSIAVPEDIVKEGTHNFVARVLRDHHKNQPPSPYRHDGIPGPQSTSHATTKVDQPTVYREYAVPDSGVDPESCHLLPRCNCDAGADSDKANRLILSPDLHAMYDNSARVTFYSESQPADTEEPQEVVVTAQFAAPAVAGKYSASLRNATTASGNQGGFPDREALCAAVRHLPELSPQVAVFPGVYLFR